MVSLWKQGEEKAFDCLYKRYVTFLVNTAAQKLSSIETAKELVQDIFLSLYLRRDQLETVSSLKAYLFTSLKHKVYNHYHREMNKQKYERSAGNNLKVVSNDLQDDYEAKELNQLLQEKINELPPQCKKVFLLSREEHLTQKEIAERLNISPNTVDQHIQKALRILRANVGGMLMLAMWMKNF